MCPCPEDKPISILDQSAENAIPKQEDTANIRSPAAMLLQAAYKCVPSFRIKSARMWAGIEVGGGGGLVCVWQQATKVQDEGEAGQQHLPQELGQCWHMKPFPPSNVYALQLSLRHILQAHCTVRFVKTIKALSELI